MKEHVTLHIVRPRCKTVPRETRRVSWEALVSFNAVDILTDEETRQLTDASRDTYPMQRVDRQKRTYARRERLIMFSCLQGTRVDWLDVETLRQRENFSQILLLATWSSTFCRSFSQSHVFIRFHERILPRTGN